MLANKMKFNLAFFTQNKFNSLNTSAKLLNKVIIWSLERELLRYQNRKLLPSSIFMTERIVLLKSKVL